jgi:hypothetical protein
MELSRPCPIKCFNFESGIDFVLWSSFPPPENQFHDVIDSHQESIFQTKSLSVVLSCTHPIAVAYIPLTLLYFLTKCIPVTCQYIFALKSFLNIY